MKKKKTFKETVNNHLPDHNIDEMLNGKSFGSVLLDVGGSILMSSVKTLLSDKAAESFDEICNIGIEKAKNRLKKNKDK